MRHEIAFAVPDAAVMPIGVPAVSESPKGVQERGAADTTPGMKALEAKTGGNTSNRIQTAVVRRGAGVMLPDHLPGVQTPIPHIPEHRAIRVPITHHTDASDTQARPAGPAADQADTALGVDAMLGGTTFISADSFEQDEPTEVTQQENSMQIGGGLDEDNAQPDEPADEARSTKPRRRSKKKAGAAAAVGAAAVFTLAACTGPGTATNPPPAATSSQAPGTDNPAQQMDTFYQRVIGPCMPQSGAAACDASHTGDIALVNFGQPEAEAQGTAAAMQKFIREGSDGKLDPHITIVNASEQAKQDLEYVTMSNVDCVDIDSNPYNSPAVIAGYDMQQQLKEDALVVSLSAINACDTGEAARADLENGRYADIFTNRVGNTITAQGEVPPPPKYKNLVLGLNGAHEVFHLEKQGHTGAYAGKQKDGIYSPFLLESTHRPFNLAKFLTGGNFDEYGSTSVMGDYIPYDVEQSSGKEKFSPTPYPPDVYPWQLDTFEELKAETEKKPGILHERTIGEKGLFISTKDAKEGKYGIAHLQKPVFLQSVGTGDQYLFDTIAFAPTVDQGQTSVQVWLIKFDNPAYGVPQTTSVNIGTLDPSTYGPMSLAYNHQLFTVNFGSDGVEIHSVSSN